MTSTWYRLAMAQNEYALSERLIRAISGWTINPQDTVESLIAEGANINRAHGTLLPLHCACMASDSECVKLLLKSGAEVNRVDGYERTAIHYAAEKDMACLCVLLEFGADINSRDGNYDTPLHWACFRNNVESTRVLLEHSALVDAVDFNHDTPLNWASLKGNLECITLLLEYGAETHISNCNGISPLHRVCSLFAMGLSRDRDRRCLDILAQATGQIDLRDHNGEFPSVISNDSELKTIITGICCSPRLLRQLCRYRIRQSLIGGNRQKLMGQLPLPAPLQRYLLFQNGE
ncbi:ankyrin repeat and SOCS box protein 8-like [Acanthaster planci]|uniref:Ankyrin repeat and SOCS box protein 8-like n=1 Tax=Acanthaster planci TaxID=133434 RepID=A0A8B7Z530_ACAPL|nr:ankyrin repeat and SOCS box protein 8-like [Acanthaster planci]XP_022098446.1 ankyrin repeat and SOCS box protein 8-like [Acanthaster planci]